MRRNNFLYFILMELKSTRKYRGYYHLNDRDRNNDRIVEVTPECEECLKAVSIDFGSILVSEKWCQEVKARFVFIETLDDR